MTRSTHVSTMLHAIGFIIFAIGSSMLAGYKSVWCLFIMAFGFWIMMKGEENPRDGAILGPVFGLLALLGVLAGVATGFNHAGY